MQNLAGHKQATEICTLELRRCGIEIVKESEPIGEPKAMVSGRLGQFRFRRAWYYWVVDGDVPLDVARELYADPIGATDIRVAGHCGCPAPASPWVEWRMDDGKHVRSLKEKAKCDGLIGSSSSLAVFAQETLDKCLFSDDPESISAKGYVTNYHIDSELGLYIFVQALKHHKLV